MYNSKRWVDNLKHKPKDDDFVLKVALYTCIIGIVVTLILTVLML